MQKTTIRDEKPHLKRIISDCASYESNPPYERLITAKNSETVKHRLFREEILEVPKTVISETVSYDWVVVCSLSKPRYSLIVNY